MEEYRTEEEQVEALRRWWSENGRSTIVAIIVALSAGFGWQGWQSSQQSQRAAASNIYQQLLQARGAEQSAEDAAELGGLAEQLKADYSSSTYAQFAALHLAAMAVQDNSLSEAEAQLRWVLGKASSGSDIAQIAQLRLARVLASSGDTDQALAILAGEEGSFSASYAIARGDVLLGAGRTGEARDAYTQALALSAGAGGNLQVLQQKVQSLTPVPPKELQTPPDSAIGESATIPAVDIVEEN